MTHPQILRKELEKLPAQIADAKAKSVDDNRAVSALEKRMVEITTLLNKPAQGDRSILSDHALIQYLERVKGIDLSKFRDEILTPETLSAVSMGATAIKAGGAKFKVQNGVIVTVI
jgi:hypothetical protein